MRKKHLIYVCSVAMVFLLLIIGWKLKNELINEQDVSPFSKIGEACNAKFEFCKSDDCIIYITSEIKTLSNTFLSLVLETSDIPVSEWIYRITFNCAELTKNDQEIVVLIGDKAMSINGVSYSTPKNVPFESVVDLFASKYKYFSTP